MLKEIRIFSRGGQGGVTGAKLLAYAGSLQGLEVQAIPKYGAERKGAPLYVDVRISDKPIKTHSPVGGDADHYIILEPSLIHKLPDIRDDALIVINSYDIPNYEFKSDKVSLGTIDAYKIAEEENLIKSGTPIVSTIMLGAYCRATDNFISLDNMKRSIQKSFKGILAENNINAINKAYINYKRINLTELLTN